MLREYCPVIGASHAEGEASSSIAPWRLSVSVQHRLIALSLLTSSDHASSHSLHLQPIPPPLLFLTLSSLFSFIPHIYVLFSDPLPCVEKHPSPSPPLHPFFFFLPSLLSLNPRTPQSIFSSFLSFSPFLAMLQCSCGNFGIMPVVLWPWLGGVSSKDPEGCFSFFFFFFCLCKLGVLGSVLDWKGEQLEGWRPVGANRGHRGHNHSKPFGSQLKGRG